MNFEQKRTQDGWCPDGASNVASGTASGPIMNMCLLGKPSGYSKQVPESPGLTQKTYCILTGPDAYRPDRSPGDWASSSDGLRALR